MKTTSKLAFAFGLTLTATSWSSTLQNEVLSQMRGTRNIIENHLDQNNCSMKLSEINKTLEDVNSVNWTVFKNKNNTSNLIKSMFYSRLSLRNKLFSMSSSRAVDKACENEVRRAIVGFRFLEEYTAKVSGYEDDVEVFQGAEPYLLVNPKFKEFKLQSGDILISRGNAIVSAAIAQIGEQDGHFSHAALVYIDPATNKTYAIEAHIEIGNDVRPIEDGYLKDGKVRAVVYRQKDPVLAAQAAKLAFDRISAAKNSGERIMYNFAMDLENEAQLFCSQVPYIAYKNGSHGEFVMGKQYQTTFGMKNKTFLNNIGVTVSHTFAPSDVELDSQLELVAEWRDLGRAHQTHRKDAVVNRIYEWMEQGTNFDLSKKRMDAALVKFLRDMPLLNNLVKGSVAPNITKPALKTMMVLNDVGDKMLDDLIEAYTAKLDKTGIPMNQTEMIQALEEAKKADVKRYQVYKSWERQHPSCSGEGDMCLDRPERPHFIDFFVVAK